MAIDLQADELDYYQDAQGNYVGFPKGTDVKIIEQQLQQSDPDYRAYQSNYLDIPGAENIPTFPEFKQQIQQQKQKQKEVESRGVGEKLVGAGEAGLSLVSSVASGAASPFVWFGESIKDMATGQPVVSFEEAMPQIVEAGTYQPRTEVGQEYLKDVGSAISESKIEGAVGLPFVGKTMPANISSILPKKTTLPKQPGKPGVVSEFAGLTTGTGGQAMRNAFDIGLKGAKEEVDAFTNAIKGNVPAQQTVNKAKSALDKIKSTISLEYRANKANLKKDKSIIGFDDIDESLEKISSAGQFKGQAIKESTQEIQQKITKIVNDWKKLDPAEYHTPEGFDALKQKIGDFYETTKPGTSERNVVNQVYNSIGDTIRKNAPIYDEMMSDYAAGKNLIREIEDTFSLKEGKPTDTQFRKLQSVLRSNVNTNFGERFNLAQRLNELEPTLFPEITGQTLNPLAPSGIQRAVGGANLLAQAGNVITGGASIPLEYLLTLPAQSPRVMGNIAYRAGQTSGLLRDAGGAFNRAIIDPSKNLTGLLQPSAAGFVGMTNE